MDSLRHIGWGEPVCHRRLPIRQWAIDEEAFKPKFAAKVSQFTCIIGNRDETVGFLRPAQMARMDLHVTFVVVREESEMGQVARDQDDLTWYSRNLPSLIRDYDGQWVAIADNKVVAAAPELLALCDIAATRGYENPLLIQVSRRALERPVP